MMKGGNNVVRNKGLQMPDPLPQKSELHKLGAPPHVSQLMYICDRHRHIWKIFSLFSSSIFLQNMSLAHIWVLDLWCTPTHKMKGWPLPFPNIHLSLFQIYLIPLQIFNPKKYFWFPFFFNLGDHYYFF